MLLATIAGIAAVITAIAIGLLRRLFARYALARPNARSSHKLPTPQGGGAAVVLTVLIVFGASATATGVGGLYSLLPLLAASTGLAVLGAIDDIRPLDAPVRLLFQALAVLTALSALPAELRIIDALPYWFERAGLFLGLLWFVNLVNFMDGIDWITVAEVVPVTAALALFGWQGALPAGAALVATALCGALIGFAPFNKPVARLFLGDVGSLPIGLLLGWLLIVFAADHLAAALLLPLYYIADATITLLGRFARGARITEAHRDHFYQRALDGGRGIYAIVGSIFALNIFLAALAAVTIVQSALAVQIACCVAGAVAVAAELTWLGRKPSRS